MESSLDPTVATSHAELVPTVISLVRILSSLTYDICLYRAVFARVAAVQAFAFDGEDDAGGRRDGRGKSNSHLSTRPRVQTHSNKLPITRWPEEHYALVPAPCIHPFIHPSIHLFCLTSEQEAGNNARITHRSLVVSARRARIVFSLGLINYRKYHRRLSDRHRPSHPRTHPPLLPTYPTTNSRLSGQADRQQGTGEPLELGFPTSSSALAPSPSQPHTSSRLATNQQTSQRAEQPAGRPTSKQASRRADVPFCVKRSTFPFRLVTRNSLTNETFDHGD